MNKYMHLDKLNIIKLTNLKTLELKIEQIRNTYGDETQQEKEIIDLFVVALVSHGKKQKQIYQISKISKILGESLGLKGEYCNQLEKAARIYDIGNIMICSDVYKKDEKLTFEEFEIVKYHTQTGYNILIEQKFSTMDMAAVISAEHHEWWNGGGYPCCLKGKKEIDIAARIVAVADTVGALFTERPGRKAWDYDKIIEYIKRRDGIQFDPSVVEMFLLNQKVIYEVLHA